MRKNNSSFLPIKIKGILFLVFLSLFIHSQGVYSLTAQNQFQIEHLGISSGLSNAYVSKIDQDNLGRMWFASEGGLNRYDGNRFKLFRPNKRYQELLNENIETVFIDDDENIWVGTKSGGFSKYDPKLDQFTNLNDKIIDGEGAIRITDFTQDKNGNLWVATWDRGLYQLSLNNDSLVNYYLQSTVISDLQTDEYGNVWAVTYGALLKYDPSEDRLITIDLPLGFGMALFYDEKAKKMLIGSSIGLFEFDPQNHQLTEFEESITKNFSGINAINIDRNGRIWVGSWKQGLYLSDISQTSFENFQLMPDDPNNTNYEVILDIFINQNGLIWVGTAYGGVVKISPQKSVKRLANTIEKNVGLPDNNIQVVTIDSEDALWCGTWGGGIGYSPTGEFFESLPNNNPDKVSAFLQIGNRMIVGTSRGIRIYDVLNPQRGPLASAMGVFKIKDVFLDDDERLWIGTQQRGLFVTNYKKDPMLKNPIQYSADDTERFIGSNRISQIAQDQNKNLWVGTYNGLYVFNNNDSTFTRKDVNPRDAYPSVIFLTVMASKDGKTLWLGMPGGLLKSIYENNELKIINIFNINSGLKNDYITAVSEDEQGNIWMSNASGISTVRNESQSIINLTGYKDRFYSMNINAVFNNSETIYFGSSNGLMFFDPIQINMDKNPPKIIFENLKIDNKTVLVGQEVNGRIFLEKTMPFTKEITITHKESIVSIGFLSSDFGESLNQKYQYRIVGLQDKWIDNGSSEEISLIGLNAGSYVVEVRSTLDNVRFSEVSTLKLTVIPPPWLSYWAFVVYAFILVSLVFLISQFFIARTKLKGKLAMAKLSQEKEHELNEAKLRFFTNISHELRTPLTLIISPVTELLKKNKIDPAVRERLFYIEKNANRLLDLINQLLDFRKAEQGELKLEVATGNFVKFSKEVFLSFKGFAEAKGVSYVFHSAQNKVELTYDRDKMEMLLCNLLSNAFKFNSEKGTISMSISEDDKNCYVKVKDSGKGISKSHQDKIFNRFFQIQGSESAKVVGSGIGLSLSQKIARLHHGDISINSGKGKGTEFIVNIPKGYAHFDKSEMIVGFMDSEVIKTYASRENMDKPASIELKEKEELLIIDDNQDILSYLKTIFEESGHLVRTAENGLSGKELAFKHIPDLIISDVMMPEMDGIELCKALKKDITTSHIPIVLLTARTSTVYEIDGLDQGADDYVRKPFDPEVIRSRVSTLLENRRKIRAALLNKIRFEFPGKNINPINKEEAFINNLTERVEGYIEDSNFNIEVLADDLCMSQSTLYRKIKSLTGMSIAAFIRSVRLKKAAEVLLTEDLNMNQVAYKVGFNDYRYFKKSFKEQFGCLPSEYEERQREGQEY